MADGGDKRCVRASLDPEAGCVDMLQPKGQCASAWTILWEPFAEFPLLTRGDKAATVAALLTAVAQKKLSRAPAFAFTGPAASGKTRLATCIAELAGGGVAVVPECGDEEELRKRLLSVLRGGQSSILFDNIRGTFASSALEAFLTCNHIAEHALGAHGILRLPAATLVLITGDTRFVPAGDQRRRILTCRIDPGSENAHLRTFKRDPEQHVRSNRQKLAAAALTLLGSFIAAGKPRFTNDRLASFEQWDGLVRQCVLWLDAEGIADLGDPLARLIPER